MSSRRISPSSRGTRNGFGAEARFELAQRSRIIAHGAVRYIVGLPESRGYPEWQNTYALMSVRMYWYLWNIAH